MRGRRNLPLPAEDVFGHSKVRPLVVPVSPLDDGESLIGMVARAAAGNVIRDVNVVLRSTGRRLNRPGFVGQVFDDLVDRLARKIGCSVEDVATRLHNEADSGSERSRGGDNTRPVHWGGGLIERRHLDLTARWISPGALEISEHHRASWLCRLLPFCTETLEPLVDRCGACGGRLGWIHARGIGVCEHCRSVVSRSTASRLDPGQAPGYVRFAELISPVQPIRTAAWATLPTSLSALGPIALARLTVGLGRKLVEIEKPVEPGGSGELDERRRTAHAVALGAMVLADWPHVLRDRVGAAARSATTVAERSKILDLRRATGKGSAEHPVLREALPEVFENQRRALCFDAPAVLARDVAVHLKGNISKFREFEKAIDLNGVDTSAGRRIFRQYDARTVESIARRIDASARMSRLIQPTGLPSYAIEQMICLGAIEQERDPAVVALDPRTRLVKKSIDSLLHDLHDAHRFDKPDGETLTLQRLAFAVGGRMKPWGPVIQALRSREIPCWLRDDVSTAHSTKHRPFIERTLVRIRDASALFDRLFDESEFPAFPFATRIDQNDVLDIVNVTSPQARALGGPGGLVFERVGKAKLADRTDAIALARRIVGVGELSVILDQTWSYVIRMMARFDDLERECFGWRRDRLIENWPRIVETIQADGRFRGPRKAIARPLTDGHAQLACDRLKASLSWTG